MVPAGLALFLICWASLYLLDVFLKTNRFTYVWYISFLEKTGLSVSICQLRWFTTSFNRLFVRFGQCRPRFLKCWFNVGVIFGLVSMVISVFLLGLMVYNTLKKHPIEQQVLTPVMPGVNLPMHQISYYLLTLLICGILHEIGHAIAAVREQVRVNGFGIFLFAIYPGAFVDLLTEHLQVISPLRQLRIYCSGVWHNFVIVIVALFVLFAVPWILLPFYTVGSSVVITGILQKSAVSGPRGLAVGEAITSVSGCPVTSINAWHECIRKSSIDEIAGFCMPVEQMKQLDISFQSFTTAAGNVECCSNISNTHICFKYHSKASSKIHYACLPARATTDNRQICRLQSDCYNPKREHVCVYPSLDNSTRLLRVKHGRKPPLLFLGYPVDLLYSVTLSDYVPKSSLIPLNLPYVLETFSKYLISLSGALAILNVVPCYALDGQWILHAFIELTLRSTIPDHRTRGVIFSIILLFGTVLVALNIIIAMWTLFS
ncbi:membrane-bound transcription factor site-2 protease-like [Tubulanus polymorphus]|uniref:membrane-bound transcription factor site-2 protease-like n=1 Tax=Tubulanus polymorphus TaxID=672921 RepID=UPI003DA4BA76